MHGIMWGWLLDRQQGRESAARVNLSMGLRNLARVIHKWRHQGPRTDQVHALPHCRVAWGSLAMRVMAGVAFHGSPGADAHLA